MDILEVVNSKLVSSKQVKRCKTTNYQTAIKQIKIMSKLQTQTRKIEISIVEENKELRKEKYALLFDYLNKAYKIANQTVNTEFQKLNLMDSLLFADKNFCKEKRQIEEELKKATESKNNKLVKKLENRKKDLFAKYKKEINDWFNERYGFDSDNIAYRNIAETIKGVVPSNIYGSIVQRVTSQLRNGKEYFEIKIGKKSLKTYKKGMPIYFGARKYMTPFEHICQYLDEKGKRNIQRTYAFKFSKQLIFKFNFGQDKSNNRIFVEKWMTGEYKFCGSSLQYNSNKNKWFLLASFKVPRKKYSSVKDRRMGVDIGINSAAFCGLPHLMVGQSIGDGKELIRVKQRLYYKKRELQKALKLAKGGRGRKRKLAALHKHEAKERNFTRTTNHKIAKEVVVFAVKHNVEIIVLEDLSGINKENVYLQRWWSYFELQTLIEQKASQYEGLEVIKVDRAYTSQICCYCGNKDKANRPKKVEEENEQTTGQRPWEIFKCTNEACKSHSKKKKLNADFVAAINIARREEGVIYRKEKK